MPKTIHLKEAEPFKIYKYAKPGKAFEASLFIMPVGEKYSTDSVYFIEIHGDHIEVHAYGNQIELVPTVMDSSDFKFRYLYFTSVFGRTISGTKHTDEYFIAHSNAAADFLIKGNLI